jgi:alpha-L-fucosidase
MKYFLSLVLVCSFFYPLIGQQAYPPAPFGPVPTPQQVDWQQLEYYMFIHFGPNTFTDLEWGHGDEDPDVFNPTNLDARQWARIARDAGMKAIIITAKHHDGFCLWPSEFSTHTVRESPWKNGEGDILRELSEACKEYGLKFGVYLSPWDMNHPAYGTPEYNQIFANTLEEVLTSYGEVFETWFDGANGEGPNGKRQEYDWDLFHETVFRHQPNTIIFSDIGPGTRWVGNERGFAGETNWSMLNIRGFGPGVNAPAQQVLNEGNEDGEAWVPAESDVSIRPGWFYSPSTDDKVKSLNHLLQIYYGSVGRNSNLLLNVPVDRRGLIHPADSARLMELREALDASFTNNLALGKAVEASRVRGEQDQFGGRWLTDGDYSTYWAVDDDVRKASLTLDLGEETEINRVVLQEYIPLGQRIKAFNVEVWNGKQFVELDRQTTIGYKRILVFPTLTTSKVRVNILDSKASPTLAELAVYRAPEMLAQPSIIRDKDGKVTISSESLDAVITYTTDGSEPGFNAARYTGAFDFPGAGTVKAKAFIDQGEQYSETVAVDFDIAPIRWNVVSVTSSGMRMGSSRAIDSNPGTFWHTADDDQPFPHQITVDLGRDLEIHGFFYTPIQHSQFSNSGTIYQYSFLVSKDGKNWEKVIDKGTFANIKNSPVQQRIRFDDAYHGRYIQIVSHASVNDGEVATSAAEIGVITKH